MIEAWKKIDGYEKAYAISSCGRVKRTSSCDNAKIGSIRKFMISRGYNRVNLYKDGKYKNFFVHCLVAEAFLGKKPIGKEVNHKDTNKQNNCANNLEYMTKSENIQHAVVSGRFKINIGSKNAQAKIKEKDVLEIRKRYKEGETQKRLADEFNLSENHLQQIIQRCNWKYI